MAQPQLVHNDTAPALFDAGPVQVLVLDDQRFDRHRISRLCTGLEMEIEVAHADCLSSFAAQLVATRFDLIFLDYFLPDGTGLEALDMIRLSALNCNAAVIMVAGDGMEGLAEQALRGGCSDYILKDDLSPASFRRATTNALQKSRLTIGMQRQSVKRAEMEEVLKRFSTECARDIKPMVSRMMRQLRDLRDPKEVTQASWQDQRKGIEASCMRLWEFLVDLENYTGADLIGDDAAELAPPAHLTPPRKAEAKPRKAPSVFGRTKH